jgi:hypothetical protein
LGWQNDPNVKYNHTVTKKLKMDYSKIAATNKNWTMRLSKEVPTT